MSQSFAKIKFPHIVQFMGTACNALFFLAKSSQQSLDLLALLLGGGWRGDVAASIYILARRGRFVADCDFFSSIQVGGPTGGDCGPKVSTAAPGVPGCWRAQACRRCRYAPTTLSHSRGAASTAHQRLI